jgi:hypothetical protein
MRYGFSGLTMATGTAYVVVLRIPVQVGHQFQNQWGTIPFGVGHLTEDRKPFLALNIRVGGGSGETK